MVLLAFLFLPFPRFRLVPFFLLGLLGPALAQGEGLFLQATVPGGFGVLWRSGSLEVALATGLPGPFSPILGLSGRILGDGNPHLYGGTLVWLASGTESFPGLYPGSLHLGVYRRGDWEGLGRLVEALLQGKVSPSQGFLYFLSPILGTGGFVEVGTLFGLGISPPRFSPYLWYTVRLGIRLF